MSKTIAIMACCKNEELYIKEWIDYHIECGIDHFYLCDNNDADYTPRLKDVVKEYIDNEIVEVFDYSGVHPIQPVCYNDIYKKYGNDYDWYLVIDIDEFICLPKFDNKIKRFIDTIPEEYHNIGINWRYYGDNGLVCYDDRPVIERFPNPVFWGGLNGKAKCTKSMITKRGKDNIRIVHHHYLTRFWKRYDVIFRQIYRTTDNILCKNPADPIYNAYFENIYNTFYLKHFHTKTIEEYIWKIKRGDTLVLKDNPSFPYKIESFYFFNERTPEKDKIIEKYLSEVTI